MIKKYSVIFLLLVFFLGFTSNLKAELILATGDVGLFSCRKVNDRFLFLYYSINEKNFGEIYLKEFDSNWQEIKEKRLGISGMSADLAYFNNRFYIAYTSFEKEGNVRIAEYDFDWNLMRDILVTPTPYDGEVAYQLIPLDEERLCLFYARNWKENCGLKMIEFNRYLEPTEEITFMPGDVDFHVHQAEEFSVIFANNHFYVAYKRHAPLERELAEKLLQEGAENLKAHIQKLEKEIKNLQDLRKSLLSEVRDKFGKEELKFIDQKIKEDRSQLIDLKGQLAKVETTTDIEAMNIFLNEYTLNGELIRERCIHSREKLSPFLYFDSGLFYLAYEGYDYKLMKPLIYINQYDGNWNSLKIIKIHTPDTGMPRSKIIVTSEGKCYLISVSKNNIFLKEINFDLKEDKIDLPQKGGEDAQGI